MNEDEISKVLDEAIKEKQRNKDFVKSVGPAIVEMLRPILETFASNAKVSKEDLLAAVSQIKVDSPKVDVPHTTVDVKMPTIAVPKAEVTVKNEPIDTAGIEKAISKGLANFKFPKPEVTVNTPKADAPIIKVAPTPVSFPDSMRLTPNDKPFPVVMMDIAGKPMMFPQMSGGATGGKSDFFTILGIQNSSAMALVDSSGVAYSGSNPLPVNASVSVTGSGDGVIMDAVNSTRVSVRALADSNALVTALVDGNGDQITSFGGGTQYADGAQPATPTGTALIGKGYDGDDTYGVMRVLHLGHGTETSAVLVTLAADSAASVVVNSGTITTVTTLTGITNSVATVLTDSTGVAYSGSNPVPTTASLSLPSGPGDGATATRIIQAGDTVSSVVVNSGTITTVTTLTSVTNSIAAAIVDSTGVAFSGSNPVPITGNVGTVTTVTSITNSIAAAIVDSSGVEYSGSNPVPITGNIGTVTTLTGITNSIAAALVDSGGVEYSGSNPVPITGNIGTVTTVTTLTGVTNSLQVVQLDRDGNPFQPFVYGPGEMANALRVLLAGDSVSSVVVNSGTLTTLTTLTGVTNSIQVVQLDRDGNPWQPEVFGPGEQANALRTLIAGDSAVSVVVNSGTLTAVTTLTSVTNSVAAMIVDSTSVAYSGSNPMPVTVVSGASTSTLAVGDSAHRTADNGGNPVKIGGIAVTTLPTAYADGDRADFTSDKRGRQIARPIQVRDLVSTAYVSLTTGTEATLLAAVAGQTFDLIWILMSNQSTAATQVDVRPVLAGNVAMTFQVPANGTVGIAMPVPLPGATDSGNAWTVDMPDQTGTTVNISALFSREV